eukprot:2675584-Pyramimonas_sp.AAC.2
MTKCHDAVLPRVKHAVPNAWSRRESWPILCQLSAYVVRNTLQSITCLRPRGLWSSRRNRSADCVDRTPLTLWLCYVMLHQGRQTRGNKLWYEVNKAGRKETETDWEPLVFLEKMHPYVMKLVKNYDEKLKADQSGMAIRPITREE